MPQVRISSRGTREVRRLEPMVAKQVAGKLLDLAEEAPNLDLKPLTGTRGWYRLRVGEHRVLCRPVDGGWLVERVVDRRDLELAVRSLG